MGLPGDSAGTCSPERRLRRYRACQCGCRRLHSASPIPLVKCQRESRYSSRLLGNHRDVQLRERHQDPFHPWGGHPHRCLLPMPPVLHGQAEDRRCRRARRAIPQAFREPFGDLTPGRPDPYEHSPRGESPDPCGFLARLPQSLFGIQALQLAACRIVQVVRSWLAARGFRHA